jgi:diguanylate cyclase (GGDEF)-like protein
MTDPDAFAPRAGEAFLGSAERQGLSDADQDTADSDQTDADYDQTFSDIDQSASERDQRASDRDQRAADRDQADADQSSSSSQASRWSDTRRSRSQSAIDRDISVRARRQSASARDTVARLRDMDADNRDARAQRRDELAAALDAEMEALERADTASGSVSLPQVALRARRRAAVARESAARARANAADDRAAACADRLRASEDRAASAQAELALEGLDHLTGALRHSGGLEGLRRELERTRRAHEPLTVAFIDVDGLEAVNDTRGYGDGDALLQGVVASVKSVLRHYYLIARFGGDEFVCVLYGQTPMNLSERFAKIAAEVAERHGGARITVGFAHARNEDRPEQLIARAEEAMNACRRERSSVVSRGTPANAGGLRRPAADRALSERQSGGEAG